MNPRGLDKDLVLAFFLPGRARNPIELVINNSYIGRLDEDTRNLAIAYSYPIRAKRDLVGLPRLDLEVEDLPNWDEDEVAAVTEAQALEKLTDKFGDGWGH